MFRRETFSLVAALSSDAKACCWASSVDVWELTPENLESVFEPDVDVDVVTLMPFVVVPVVVDETPLTARAVTIQRAL